MVEIVVVVKVDVYGLGVDYIVFVFCECGVKIFFVVNVFEGI